MHRHDHESGRRTEAAGERVLELRAAARRQSRPRRPEPPRAGSGVALRRHRGRGVRRPISTRACRPPTSIASRFGRLLTNLHRQRRRRGARAHGAGARLRRATSRCAPCTTRRCHAVRLEVVDDGIGIRPEDRRRIFEPYFSTQGARHRPRARDRLAHRRRPPRLRPRPRRTGPAAARFIVELPGAGTSAAARPGSG